MQLSNMILPHWLWDCLIVTCHSYYIIIILTLCVCCVWYKYPTVMQCLPFHSHNNNLSFPHSFMSILVLFMCNNIFPSFCWGSFSLPHLVSLARLTYSPFSCKRGERERESVREEKDCLASKTNAISAHKHSKFGCLLGSGQITHNGLIFNVCPIYLLGAIIFLLCYLEQLGALSIVVCKFTNSTA